MALATVHKYKTHQRMTRHNGTTLVTAEENEALGLPQPPMLFDAARSAAIPARAALPRADDERPEIPVTQLQFGTLLLDGEVDEDMWGSDNEAEVIACQSLPPGYENWVPGPGDYGVHVPAEEEGEADDGDGGEDDYEGDLEEDEQRKRQREGSGSASASAP